MNRTRGEQSSRKVTLMALSKSALSLIGRMHPEIFDILGNPIGPVFRRGAEVSLNPQPLPPLSEGLRIGFLAGAELVKLGFTASRLHLGFEIDLDDWCGTYPRRPKFPPVPWPPIPWPQWDREDNNPEWVTDYNLGLAFSLELSAHMWEGLDAAGAINGVRDLALGNAGNMKG